MDLVADVEPGSMSVALSDDHAHRLWMLRRSRDVFMPLEYQLKHPGGRALYVELSPLIGDEVPAAMGPRQATARVKPRGAEYAGFVSLFTKRATDRGQLLGRGAEGLNHPDADATILWALDWLVDPAPRSKTHLLILAQGKPLAKAGPLERATADRLDWVLDQAEGRGLRPLGWKSTGDRWPCTTDEYGKKAGDFHWL